MQFLLQTEEKSLLKKLLMLFKKDESINKLEILNGQIEEIAKRLEN